MGRLDRARPILIAAVAVVLAVAGVGVVAMGSGVRAADATVKIADTGYDPDTVTITAGSVITWTNTGSSIHTVTSDNGGFDSGDLASGETFANLFDAPGTFVYHDVHNASITGTVIVTAAPPTPSGAGTPEPTPPPGTLPPGFGSPSFGPADTSNSSAPPDGDASGTSGSATTTLVLLAVAAVAIALGIFFARRRRPPPA